MTAVNKVHTVFMRVYALCDYIEWMQSAREMREKNALNNRKSKVNMDSARETESEASQHSR